MTNLNETPGERIENEVTLEYVEPPYERNGFVTFWLWLGLIGAIITLLLSLVQPTLFQPVDIQWLTRQSSRYMLGNEMIDSLNTLSTVLQWTSVICAIVAGVGYMKLLSWRKSGFYIIVVATLIECGIMAVCYSQNPYIGYVNYNLILGLPIAKCVILWAILQISKNGYSCWSQLY